MPRILDRIQKANDIKKIPKEKSVNMEGIWPLILEW